MDLIGGLKSVINAIFKDVKNNIDDNFVMIAKHFAGNTPPLNPTAGIMWEDTSSMPSITKKYTTAGTWQKIFIISYVQSSVPENPVEYECWVDLSGSKSLLKKWNGTEWILIETLGQINIDNIKNIQIADFENIADGYTLVYNSADEKMHLQAPSAAPGANATHLNSIEIDDSAKTGESDKFILTFNKSILKYVLTENIAAKIYSSTGAKTYQDIANLMSELILTHSSNAAAHHTRYTDTEARSAMGVKTNNNPLNHDRYTDTEARTAMGEKTNNNTYNHDRYTDTEARSANANYNIPIACPVPWCKNLVEGLSLPINWVECNGQTLNDSDSILNGCIIPNLNGNNRFLRGNSTSGGTGGEAQHTLTIPEMPMHNHGSGETGAVSAGEFGLIKRTVVGESKTAAFVDSVDSGDQPDVMSPPYNIALQGGNQAHENRPPFYDVVYVMRVK